MLHWIPYDSIADNYCTVMHAAKLFFLYLSLLHSQSPEQLCSILTHISFLLSFSSKWGQEACCGLCSNCGLCNSHIGMIHDCGLCCAVAMYCALLHISYYGLWHNIYLYKGQACWAPDLTSSVLYSTKNPSDCSPVHKPSSPFHSRLSS